MHTQRPRTSTRIIRSFLLLLLLVFPFTLHSLEPAAASLSREEVTGALRELFTHENLPLADERISLAALKTTYDKRSYSPIWLKGTRITPQGTSVLLHLSNAEEHGIAVSELPLHHIKELSEKHDAKSTAALDVVISHATLHFMQALAYGAQNSTTQQSKSALPSLEAVATGNPDILFAALEPPHPNYRALKTLLATYRSLEKQGGWPGFAMGKKIEAGAKDERIPHLRKLLAITGDLQQAGTLPWDEKKEKHVTPDTAYDTTLQAAVIRFQQRHGLEDDGTIGKETQAALNTPVGTRIKQIIATMQQMRSLPSDLGKRYVLVNVPGFYLQAVEAGKTELSSRVIVGQKKRRSPIMNNVIESVAFNPSWRVPSRIAVQDILPKIQNDPEFISKEGFEIYEGEGEDAVVVDPETVDWYNVDGENFPYRFRQPPGDGNALGKIKFAIPNTNAIYLHSTSQPKLFSKAKRALSSGCIRVEKPRELAHFVMKNLSQWDEEKINRHYDGNDSKTVSIPDVALYMVYWTSWIDEEGRAHFAEDIYGRNPH